jgi:signal recognition particle GTPase
MNEPVKRNGTNERNAKAVEAGLAMHLQVKSDLEDARRDIDELRTTLTQRDVAIEGMQSLITMLESRISGCVAERDLAVTKHAKLEATLAASMAIMREAQIPNVPMVRDTTPSNRARVQQ